MRWLLRFQMDRLLSSQKSLLPESMAFCVFATSHVRAPFVFYSRISTPLAAVRFRAYAHPVFRSTTSIIVSAALKGRGCGAKNQHHLWTQAPEYVARPGFPVSLSAGNAPSGMSERRMQMMDHERQERDLQEVINTTQASYLAVIENTFALQERILRFARHLIETSAEDLQTQAENNRGMLETLSEESRRHREAMESLVRESAEVYESLLRSPFSHHQDHPSFEEAKGAPEVKS
jgi:hypothetical protein